MNVREDDSEYSLLQDVWKRKEGETRSRVWLKSQRLKVRQKIYLKVYRQDPGEKEKLKLLEWRRQQEIDGTRPPDSPQGRKWSGNPEKFLVVAQLEKDLSRVLSSNTLSSKQVYTTFFFPRGIQWNGLHMVVKSETNLQD